MACHVSVSSLSICRRPLTVPLSLAHCHLVAQVSHFNIRIAESQQDASAPPHRPLPHPTSMHLYNRGSQRGMGIYIGKSTMHRDIHTFHPSSLQVTIWNNNVITTSQQHSLYVVVW